jgi:hypothetical protein
MFLSTFSAHPNDFTEVHEQLTSGGKVFITMYRKRAVRSLTFVH